VARCERLVDVCEAATQDLKPDTAMMWTGRKVNAAFFAEHMREEMVLHRWDKTGDDATAMHSLTEPWMTQHSVHDVGTPQLARGTTTLDLGPTSRVEGRRAARLRIPQDSGMAPAGGRPHAGTTPRSGSREPPRPSLEYACGCPPCSARSMPYFRSSGTGSSRSTAAWRRDPAATASPALE
jgi:hypothetical protein